MSRLTEQKHKGLCYRIAFSTARVTIYATVLGTAILLQFFDGIHFLCEQDAYSCPMCGMRTAVKLILKGRFSQAQSINRFSVYIIPLLILVIGDMLYAIVTIRKCNRLLECQ